MGIYRQPDVLCKNMQIDKYPPWAHASSPLGWRIRRAFVLFSGK